MSSLLSNRKLLLCLKLITSLLFIPALFSFVPILKFWHNTDKKCFVGPPSSINSKDNKDNGSTSEIHMNVDERQYYGVWIPTQRQSYLPQQEYAPMRKCNIHHPSQKSRMYEYHRTKSNTSIKIIDGSWLDCTNIIIISNPDEQVYITKYGNMPKAHCTSHSHGSGGSGMFFCNDMAAPNSSSSTGTSASNAQQFKLSGYCSLDKNDNKYRNHKNKQEELFPSTILLLILNISLAFIYWDKRIDPSTVSKQYTKIVNEKEIWRSFTGALAHFEPMHLLFNMMTLQALGSSLEGEYIGSIPFLFSNICLIPLTTIMMIGLIQVQVKYTGNEQYKQTSSVGYSGVLFAWSVVSALQNHAVCPIPFASDMCFHTHQIHIYGSINFKFNFGPFIQLLFMQFIMPRASFIGHLSGIVCGFIFHWKILPEEIFWNPQVLIPGILLMHWRFVHKLSIMPKLYIYHNHHNDGRSTESGNPLQSLSSSKKEKDCIESIDYLRWTQRFMTCISILSIWSFGIFSAMTLSQILSCIVFTLSLQCTMNIRQQCHDSSSTTTQQCMFWRGTIITFILILVTDALVVPSWLISQLFIHSNNLFKVDVWKEPLIMILRWIIHVIGLMIASTSLRDLDGYEAEPKIFSKVFGAVVIWSSELFPLTKSTSSTSDSSIFIPFGGSGNTLGSGSNRSRGSIESPQRSRLLVQAETV